MKKAIYLLLTLLPLKLMATTIDPYLTLYFIPSPVGMDWSSPANLAKSAFKNKISFQSRFMGHVFVEFQCNGKKELTGMVGSRFDYLTQLLINNRGLGILYHSFEGKLEDAADVEKEIAELSAEGKRMNFVTFKLNEGQCQRVASYLSEYREKNVGRYYGLANRPLHAEGAGCSAFGASFLEVAGVMDVDINDAWSHTVNIPLAFAGPPLRDEGVSLFKLVVNASSWAKENEQHQKLFFWSPDRMFDWVNKRLSNKEDKSYSEVTLGKSKGIMIDKSHLPAPGGPIWQQRLPASASADPSKETQAQ